MKIKQMTEFIVKVIKGMIIGLASITAGAGTFAIVLGIYDRCMAIIAKPFKHFKQNVIYLFPILLGLVISVFIFKNAISYLFTNYSSYVKCVFFGIIIGGIPTLMKVANKEGKNKKFGIAFVVAFILTIIATYYSSHFSLNSDLDHKLEWYYLVIYGIIYGFGAVMPGMTTLHILIYLGVWGPIFAGVLAADLSVIIPFGIGYLVIVLLTANIMSYCFNHFYGYTYYAIIGFSVTSLIMLIPQVTTNIEKIVCPILLIATALGMYYITRLEDKIKEKEKQITE